MASSDQSTSATATKSARRSWVVIPPVGAEAWILRDCRLGTEWRFATQREALRFALFQAADPQHASVST